MTTVETTRQKNARLRKAIADAEQAVEVALRAEAKINAAFSAILEQGDAEQFLRDHDWNAAHDAVAEAEMGLKFAWSQWYARNIDPATLALMHANID